MKFKRIKVLVLVSMMVVSTLALTGCGKSEKINEGSSQSPINSLVEEKDTKVGDNSKVSDIISKLPVGEYVQGFELLTTNKPYEIIINYGDVEGNEVKFADSEYTPELLEILTKKNAMIMLSLVKNADVVNFNVNEESKYKYTREELTKTYGEEYGKDLEKITETQESLIEFFKQELN